VLLPVTGVKICVEQLGSGAHEAPIEFQRAPEPRSSSLIVTHQGQGDAQAVLNLCITWRQHHSLFEACPRLGQTPRLTIQIAQIRTGPGMIRRTHAGVLEPGDGLVRAPRERQRTGGVEQKVGIVRDSLQRGGVVSHCPRNVAHVETELGAVGQNACIAWCTCHGPIQIPERLVHSAALAEKDTLQVKCFGVSRRAIQHRVIGRTGRLGVTGAVKRRRLGDDVVEFAYVRVHPYLVPKCAAAFKSAWNRWTFSAMRPIFRPRDRPRHFQRRRAICDLTNWV